MSLRSGATLDTPLDLTGRQRLKFDVATDDIGTSGEFAIQVGPDSAWCQGSIWAWTNPVQSRTVTAELADLGCPADACIVDFSDVRAVYVFLNGQTVHIDNVRVE